MHVSRRALLTLAFLLLSGAALAQGFGFGMGVDDLTGRPQRPGPPAVVGNLLLVGGGNILLVGGGNLTCLGPC